MKLADLYDDSVPLTIKYRGRTIELEIYPERLTREFTEECVRLEEEKTGAGELHTLRTVIKSWSLEDPIDEKTLKRMTPGLKRAIMQAANLEANFPTEAARRGLLAAHLIGGDGHGRRPQWYTVADNVKLAAKWWGTDPLVLMGHEGAEVLIRRALVAIGAESDAAEFAQKKAAQKTRVKRGGR